MPPSFDPLTRSISTRHANRVMHDFSLIVLIEVTALENRLHDGIYHLLGRDPPPYLQPLFIFDSDVGSSAGPSSTLASDPLVASSMLHSPLILRPFLLPQLTCMHCSFSVTPPSISVELPAVLTSTSLTRDLSAHGSLVLNSSSLLL